MKSIEKRIFKLIHKYEKNDKIIKIVEKETENIIAIYNSNNKRHNSIIFLAVYICLKSNQNTFLSGISTYISFFKRKKKYLNKIKDVISIDQVNKYVIDNDSLFPRDRLENKKYKLTNRDKYDNIYHYIRDAKSIYLFVQNKNDQFDLNNFIFSEQGRRLGLYACFFKKKLTTNNHEEIIAFHYTKEKNIKSILEKGIIPSPVENNIIKIENQYVFLNAIKDLFKHKFYRDTHGYKVRFKIKCHLNDIEFWTNGFMLRTFEVLFKKIEPEKIIGYKIFKEKSL